jgi:hypothetical protein
MTTIRSFTSLEQSRKLAEILPIESADMSWVSNGLGKPFARTIPINGDPEELCGCWSLAALLSVLPDYTLQTNTDGTVFVVCESKKPMISDAYDNPVDACCEMIIKLHELKML